MISPLTREHMQDQGKELHTKQRGRACLLRLTGCVHGPKVVQNQPGLRRQAAATV